MPIALSEFWSRLVATGLADSNDCKRFAAAFSSANGGSPPDSAESLGAFLAKTGQLTSYQVKGLLGSDVPAIRFGAFVMTSDQPVRPLIHWMPVRTAVTDPPSEKREGFLLRVPLSGLDDTRRAWLATHSEVSLDSLQPIELSGGATAGNQEQVVEIFSAFPEGAPLWNVLQKKPQLSTRKTVRIGVDLARALDTLHNAPTPRVDPSLTGIVHGALGVDHVWVTPKGNAILMRDPSSPARSPHADTSGSWIERIELPSKFAAPELADPNALPTARSDIYALGCLLFQLLTGRAPFSGNDSATLFAAHQNEFPEELKQATVQGADGDPLMRVLAYAMAKDPTARFESGSAFAEALTRAGEFAATKKTAPDKRATPPAPAKPAVPEPPPKQARASKKKSSPVSQPPSKSPNVPRQPADKKASHEPDPASEVAAPATRSRKTSPPPVNTPPKETPLVAPPTAVEPPVVESPQPKHTDDTESVLTEDSTATIESQPSDQAATESTTTTRARKRRRRNKNRIPILAGIMVLPLMMLGLAVFLAGRGPQEARPKPRPSASAMTNVPKVGQARRDIPEPPKKVMVGGYEIIDSDRLLWVPPYAVDSKPPSLELLPPGPAGIFSVRVAHLLSSADASPIIGAFQPEIESLLSMLEKRSGVSRGQIQRCTVSLFPGRDGWPEVALAIELIGGVPISQLTNKWGAQSKQTPDGSTYFAGESSNSDAFYIGDGEKGNVSEDQSVSRFAVGPIKRIAEVVENEGGGIPLVPRMQSLWDETSNESDLVAVMTPNFLLTDGRQLIASTAPEFREPLNRWLIPDVSAVSLTATATASGMYSEVRETPAGGATTATLLKSLRETIASWPKWADQFILQANPDPSWKLLSNRLPFMLRFVGKHIRSNIDGDSVVASSYLPNEAAAQTALATLLAMNTARGGSATPAVAQTKTSLSVDQILDLPMTIAFTQESLQLATGLVVDEFAQGLPDGTTMPKVRIVGGDLEKNGITQNQQIRNFDRSNVPFRQVLTDLVVGANLNKSVTDPKSPEQLLVWVVHPVGKSPAETEILITTRDASKDKYELPREFVAE